MQGVVPASRADAASLGNILRVLERDLGVDSDPLAAAPTALPSLGSWAEQGVLLANTTLTTQLGKVGLGGIQAVGWQQGVVDRGLHGGCLQAVKRDASRANVSRPVRIGAGASSPKLAATSNTPPPFLFTWLQRMAHGDLWGGATVGLLRGLAARRQGLVFMLWGRHARSLRPLLTRMVGCGHVFIESSHPSPLSAWRASGTAPSFMDSRPFSRCNEVLEGRGEAPIDWRKLG